MSGKTEATITLDPNFIKKVQNAAKAGVRDCFKQIVPDAKANSPYLTGANADSIAAKIRSYPGKVFARIFTQSGHGGYLERGTSKMAPSPYIFPAVERGLAMLPLLLFAKFQEFSAEVVPDELIGRAIARIRTSKDKGVGIVGGKEARKKQELKRLRGGV